ncbi:MAG TPA: hypothetical protein VE969_09520 [Pyrinomonadaceae bacterium]|nr:hypothetical protein [Pyrinomonadaceae bacterium]
MKSLLRITICLSALMFPAWCAAQDEVVIDKSLVPATADDLQKFVPRGWKIEEQIKGDLNGDSVADYALKLVEDKADKDASGDPTERYRAVVIVFQEAGGKLARAAVVGKLLQCTRCGGAFYGFVETPATLEINNGIIEVNQDHGSRNLTNTYYKFRYDAATKQFVLIGFDYADADRLTATVVSESTNYLTGVRITTRGKGNRDVERRTVVPKKKISIEDVDYAKFEEAASKRLGLQ